MAVPIGHSERYWLLVRFMNDVGFGSSAFATEILTAGRNRYQSMSTWRLQQRERACKVRSAKYREIGQEKERAGPPCRDFTPRNMTTKQHHQLINSTSDAIPRVQGHRATTRSQDVGGDSSGHSAEPVELGPDRLKRPW